MPRPCNCGRYNPGETFDRKQHCVRCYMWTTSALYRKHHGEQPQPIHSRISLPCLHEGSFAPTPAGQSPNKTYLNCEAGKGVVCKCQCNSSCDRYTPDDPEAEDLADRLTREPPFSFEPFGAHQLAAAHRVMLRRAVERPPEITLGSGRGIVQGVGGTLYFACAYICVKELRRLGCTLPIEWWHLGPAEMDPKMAALAAELGVTCVDAYEVVKRVGTPRILNGWELKAFAVAHSGFREVMYLDADNLPVVDPTYLFDDPAYQKHGAMFWPDLPPGNRSEWIPRDLWADLGLRFVNTPAFESGQFMVDKGRRAAETGVSVHINSHSDWYYRRVYGDKDTFLLAYHAYSQFSDPGRDVRVLPYGLPETPAGWVWPAIYQHGPDGRLVFQHVCQGKSDLAKGRRLNLVHGDHVIDAANHLRRVWSRRIWSTTDQTTSEWGYAHSLIGKWEYQRIGIPGEGSRTVELLSDGTIGEGSAGCERAWTVRRLGSGWTIIFSGDGHKGTQVGTMFLTEDADGVWRGRWTVGEHAAVELRPSKDVRSKMASVLVPKPPAYIGTKTSDLVVATVVVGQKAEELLGIVRPHFERYAASVGADFVVLRWPGHPDWGFSAKFAIPTLLDVYRRIAFFDVDILISAGTPDIFREVPQGKFGIMDELPRVGDLQFDLVSECRMIAAQQDLTYSDNPEWYVNTGVMVLEAAHAHLLASPEKPIAALNCAEQHLVNARIHSSGEDFYRLPQRFNAMWRHDPYYLKAARGSALHFSGMPHEERVNQMRTFDAAYPRNVESPHDIPGHFSSDDAAYYAKKAAGIPDGGRVVEVGVWLGRSISFLVEALGGRDVKTYAVDTWKGDPNKTDSNRFFSPVLAWTDPYELFDNNLQACGLRDRVEVVRKLSVEAAADFEDRSLDFVYIDAEHTFESVTADIRAWLPKVKTGGILAGHDVDISAVRGAVATALGNKFVVSGKNWEHRVRHG